LDSNTFAAALGIAGTFTGGIWAFLSDGSMTKRLHCGKAAETGLAAAYLAQSGMTGPRYVLEAEWGGFFSTYCMGDATPGATLMGLGENFGIMRSGMKPYPCCRDMHSAIDGLLAIMEETGACSAEIKEIWVHGDEQTVRQFGRRDIRNAVDAQFSFPYSLAVAALSGGAGLSQFMPLRTADPEILRLMNSVAIIPDRPLLPGEYPSVEVYFTDGRQKTIDVRYAKGAPQNPLSEIELKQKTEELIAPVLGPARCEEIVAMTETLEQISDMREFTNLLRRPNGCGGRY
jgi:2-methylcitrate dehydratase PrpD